MCSTCHLGGSWFTSFVLVYIFSTYEIIPCSSVLAVFEKGSSHSESCYCPVCASSAHCSILLQVSWFSVPIIWEVCHVQMIISHLFEWHHALRCVFVRLQSSMIPLGTSNNTAPWDDSRFELPLFQILDHQIEISTAALLSSRSYNWWYTQYGVYPFSSPTYYRFLPMISLHTILNEKFGWVNIVATAHDF